ncbi:hypothetical protein GCM10029964_035920 [Kibdelosporangium lantanae]
MQGMNAPTRGRVKLEQGHKRVRTYLGGVLVADTITPTLVWEVPYYPTYYFPRADVRVDLAETGEVEHSPAEATPPCTRCGPAARRPGRSSARTRPSRSCGTW